VFRCASAFVATNRPRSGRCLMVSRVGLRPPGYRPGGYQDVGVALEIANGSSRASRYQHQAVREPDVAKLDLSERSVSLSERPIRELGSTGRRMTLLTWRNAGCTGCSPVVCPGLPTRATGSATTTCSPGHPRARNKARSRTDSQHRTPFETSPDPEVVPYVVAVYPTWRGVAQLSVAASRIRHEEFRDGLFLPLWPIDDQYRCGATTTVRLSSPPAPSQDPLETKGFRFPKRDRRFKSSSGLA
jgi:hypothetical protein